MRKTKRDKKISEILKDKKETHSIEEAVAFLQKCPKLKFDESIDISLKLGVDPKKSDQQVRGTLSLPHGTGRDIKVLVLAKADKAKEALEAGADFAGTDEFIEKIKGGWTGFDAMIATPDMMREVGKLGRILGPRGLMPSPKAGSVTQDVSKAVKDMKAGKVEFKVDKNSVINNQVAKISFEPKKVIENIKAIIDAVAKNRPASAKGTYMKHLSISSTMGPGINIDLQTLSI